LKVIAAITPELQAFLLFLHKIISTKMVQEIKIEEFNYDLPDERIAKFPLAQRDHSKLLVRKNNQLSETSFQHLPEYIPENALLVFNNTKVIQARMIFQKETGAKIEIFCLEPHEPADYAQSFIQTQSCSWNCLVGNGKRWKSGKLKQVHPLVGADLCVCTNQGAHTGAPVQISAEKIESYGDTSLIRFEWDNPDLSFAEILEKFGELPIPPYLNRKTEESDKTTYQTVYSKIKGSVAAPTAGLHFTPEVLDDLRKKHVDMEELTLHVGAGTFKPVKSETLAGHEMHTECIFVKRSTIEKLIEKQGQVFAVGTTSVRTLESLYYIGLILENNPDATPENLVVTQWMPYSSSPPSPLQVGEGCSDLSERGEELLQNILDYMNRHDLQKLTTHTQIMIAPGYDFKIVNGIITNFHQPKSTLLLLISAFVDGKWKEIYDYALANDFRFLSYGDSSLLIN
jgi:S-adenosylmethionine:tRNA ribosyltransferase-isomerase